MKNFLAIALLAVFSMSCVTTPKREVRVPSTRQLDPKVEIATKEETPGKKSKRRGARPASMKPERRVVTCDEKDRLVTRTIKGDKGRPDKFEACMKRADDSFVWVVVTAP